MVEQTVSCRLALPRKSINLVALTVLKMCIKGVGDTFLSVSLLPEVGRGWQNVICQQNIGGVAKNYTAYREFFMPNPEREIFKLHL